MVCSKCWNSIEKDSDYFLDDNGDLFSKCCEGLIVEPMNKITKKTLRDEFAMMVMEQMPWSGSTQKIEWARDCYEIADAMMEAREEK